MGSEFDDLIAEAQVAPFHGWNFSWLRKRSSVDPLPWSYTDVVARQAARARTMLDMGTGGGEVLSGMPVRAPLTVATEAWPPNVPLAGRRLMPMGIAVVQDEGAPDNSNQNGDRGRLPFRAAAFDLVANRHEAFVATEVARVLSPGGTFVTQQVDFHTYDDVLRLLDLRIPPQPTSWAPLAAEQCDAAGLVVVESAAGEERQHFNDVAALVYYLKVVSWAVPGFDVDVCRPALLKAHAKMREAPLVVRQRRFLVVASRPD